MSDDNADNANTGEEISDEQFDTMLHDAGIDDPNGFISHFDEEAEKDDGQSDDDDDNFDDSDGVGDVDDDGVREGNDDSANDDDGGADAEADAEQQEATGSDENQDTAAEEPPPANPDDDLEGAAPSKPPAGKPAAGKPAAGKPAAGKPAAGKPAAGKPAAGKPAAGKPAAGKPAPGKPAAGKPAGGKPAGGKPAPGKPAPGKPGGKMSKVDKSAAKKMENGTGEPNSKGALDPQYQDIRQLYAAYQQYANADGWIVIDNMGQYLQQIGFNQRGIMMAQRAVPRLNQFSNGTADFENLMGLMSLVAQIY
ncbi:unnamed protein product [Rotaria sp. Silwood1]|nr:unnamed protein product [Rotaria sp. Silwood1]CAF4753488.1 unnamed protein product [Rotaria sp. Silwood1]